MMSRTSAKFLSVLLSLGGMAASSRADVVITLEAFHENGEPVSGPVALGTDVTVDILLSVDSEDDPLPDVRLIQFNFEDTSDTIQLVTFRWDVDRTVYSFLREEFPTSYVTATVIQSVPNILELTAEPLKVASVNVTIDGNGTLDLRNADALNEDFAANVQARFDFPTSYSLLSDNLQGGTLAFTVTGGSGGGGSGGGGGGGLPQPTDTDNDGVVDELDAFPTDPGETTDTNGNGVGDNADSDDDGDGVVDEDDDLPTDPDEDTDTNGDGIGNNEDPDDDGDNVADDGDAFPDDPAEAVDTDDDGTGNNTDPDDDGDGVDDTEDAFPLDPAQTGQDDGDTANGQGSSPRMCGAGLIGPSIMLFLGLGLLPRRTRR